jgi:hypothetical protein
VSYHKLTYYGSVENGTLKLSERKRFDSDLKLFEGQRVEVTVEKKKKTRSLEQNKYLWGVVYPCALHGFLEAGNEGISVDDVHNFFKERHLPKGKEIVIPKTGEVVTVSKSTTMLSTTEMMHYVEMIAKDCAEFFGIVIPEPMPLMPIE